MTVAPLYLSYRQRRETINNNAASLWLNYEAPVGQHEAFSKEHVVMEPKTVSGRKSAIKSDHLPVRENTLGHIEDREVLG